jgi:hypothetical protein
MAIATYEDLLTRFGGATEKIAKAAFRRSSLQNS